MQNRSEHCEADLDDRSLYLNREVSWLAFNNRVLDQARDTSWPLLERVKFLAIHASNLDEFFMIRVSGLHEQLDAEITEPVPDGLSTAEQLAKIRELAQTQLNVASRLFLEELMPALAEAGIRIRSWLSLSPEMQESARAYFRTSVFPVLTPLALDPGHPFPFLSNLSLSLAVQAADTKSSEVRLAFVKIPETLPRLIQLGAVPATFEASADAPTDFLALEDLMQNNLQDLFPGIVIEGSYPFRVTRDMDLDILEDEASDLLSAVDREVRRRRFGAAVRLEVAPLIPENIRAMLLEKLEIEADDVYDVEGPLGLSGLQQIAALPRPSLRDAAFSTRVPVQWQEAADPFAAIRQSDILLHHPYDSFTPVLEFLNLAADDPNVLAIKMIVYRTGSKSETIKALIRAAENGKQVAVSIELKARFDEENNIGQARAMERAGVHVFFGTAGIKTHAKALLVVRREGAELRRYVHLSTGNYNATTAKIYTDTGLFTCDPSIGEDVSELFNALSGFSNKSDYRRLFVAPVRLRSCILERIEQQTGLAKAGKEARIFAKLNSVVDKRVIQALYRASQAGVQIELVVRGICCLRPGLPGISENIRVRSLVGRFLEHERVFVFGPSGRQQLFLASADWMPRNFDRRVELLFPVANEAIRRQILAECLMPITADNCRVYEMQSDGSYTHRRPEPNAAVVDAQMHTLDLVRRNRPRASNYSRAVRPTLK